VQHECARRPALIPTTHGGLATDLRKHAHDVQYNRHSQQNQLRALLLLLLLLLQLLALDLNSSSSSSSRTFCTRMTTLHRP
jgi:hypothetical protein